MGGGGGLSEESGKPREMRVPLSAARPAFHALTFRGFAPIRSEELISTGLDWLGESVPRSITRRATVIYDLDVISLFLVRR